MGNCDVSRCAHKIHQTVLNILLTSFVSRSLSSACNNLPNESVAHTSITDANSTNKRYTSKNFAIFRAPSPLSTFACLEEEPVQHAKKAHRPHYVLRSPYLDVHPRRLGCTAVHRDRNYLAPSASLVWHVTGR